MSLYIDHKYLNIISPKLLRFKRKSRDLYNFRCPICGDSKRNQHKARGYAFVKQNTIVFKCHNCSASGSIKYLLEQLDPTLLQQYNFEKFKDKDKKVEQKQDEVKIPFLKKPTFKKVYLETVASLDIDHPAVKYVRSRKIPKNRWYDLYYTDCFKTWVTNFDVEMSSRLRPNDPRLIIPFFDKNKNIIAAQGRSLDSKSNIRYFTIKIDSKATKIYGLDRWDKSQITYVTEGPIDSLFIPNCLAMAGSDISDTDIFYGVNVVMIYDNEPRNAEIIEKMYKTLAKGYGIVVWPSSNEYKDVNDMIIGGIESDDILDTINKNTFRGLQARVKINEWKRV